MRTVQKPTRGIDTTPKATKETEIKTHITKDTLQLPRQKIILNRNDFVLHGRNVIIFSRVQEGSGRNSQGIC